MKEFFLLILGAFALIALAIRMFPGLQPTKK